MELRMNPFKAGIFRRDASFVGLRWYCKYGISYRELQEMLAERGWSITPRFTHWVQRYAPMKWKNGCAVLA